MRSLQPLLPSGRTLAALDFVLAVWAAIWIAMGLAVASEVDGLKELSSTVRTTGGAVEEAGSTLGEFEDVPVVGDRVEEPARRIREAGRSAIESGRSSRESVENLSALLGVAVAVIPSLPLLGFYLPLRLSYERERRALGAFVQRAEDPQALEAFLAGRAMQTLGYRRLRALGVEPWHDRGGHGLGPLAEAELARLGVRWEGRARV